VYEQYKPHLNTTVVFDYRDEETQLEWSILFDTEEMGETIIKAHKADEGLKQNIERLDKYFDKLCGELKTK
jgi:hypothetical protein